MGKGGGSETVTARLDPQTDRFVQDVLRNEARRGVANVRGAGPLFAPANPMQRRALGQIASLSPDLSQFMNVSSGLAGSFGGAFDPSTISTFMDPFREDVVAGTRGLFQQQREEAQRAAQQQATRAGAFGGSRSALLEGQAISDVNRQEAQVIPQILSGGHSQALRAALGQQARTDQLGLAGLQNLLAGTQFGTQFGLNQANALFSGGEAMRQIAERRMQEPLVRESAILNLANLGIGPFGQTTTTQAGGGNPLAGAFGGALTGLAVTGGNPIGAAAGGGIGLLGGLL